MNSSSMIEINIIFILPRLVFNNGVLIYNFALLLIVIIGYYVNKLFLLYA